MKVVVSYELRVGGGGLEVDDFVTKTGSVGLLIGHCMSWYSPQSDCVEPVPAFSSNVLQCTLLQYSVRRAR